MMTPTEKWRSIPPEQFLKERFHINTGFHPGQRAIIEQLVQGQRVLAIQRTGWGKSLCYQMASLYYPHLTIVFSPLKALMRDQCQRCNNWYNIPSAIISSDFSEEENQITMEQAVAGNFKILYIAPERLDNANWQTHVTHMRISMYRAVDLVRTRYPIETINGIVSVPPTKSGPLVETFAKQVATQLGIEFLPVLEKVRPTQEQKFLTNWRQKVDNVKGAFCARSSEFVTGRTLLLIDDIYDSGYMLREVAQTLKQAGASAVYPLTITRTAHSDDQ